MYIDTSAKIPLDCLTTTDEFHILGLSFRNSVYLCFLLSTIVIDD